MAQLNKYCLLCVLLLGLLVQSLIGAETRIESPEQLIASFYESLLADAPVAKLPEIFAEPTSLASALKPSNDKKNDKNTVDSAVATQAVWQYFRDNKELFLFETIEPSQTLKKCRFNYCFIAIPSSSIFFDGIFCIELTSTLSKGGKEGVYKQIRFPLKRNDGPTGPQYLILESIITVNGVLMDPSREYKRDENLYQKLGFTEK